MYVNIKTFWHGMAWKEGKWRAGTRGTWGDGWKWHMIRSMLAEKQSQMPVSFGRGQSNIRNRTGRGDTVRPYKIRTVRYLAPVSRHGCCGFCGFPPCTCQDPMPGVCAVLWSHELLVAVGLGPGAVSLFELGWSELCCGSPGHIVLLRSWDSTAL